jgi:hypothetical protein
MRDYPARATGMAMAQSKIEVDKKLDKTVIEFFQAAKELLSAPQFQINIAGGTHAIQAGDPDSDRSLLDSILAYNGYLIQNVSLNLDRFTVSFIRNSNEATAPGYDVININNNQRDNTPPTNPVSQEKIIKLNALVSEKFSPDAVNASAIFRNPAIFRDVMKSHQRMLEKMQETIAAVGENAAEARSSLEKEYWDKQAELAREFDKRKTALDAQAAKRQRDFEELEKTKLEELSNRESELAERGKHLDDRNNTHARRALHSTLKSRLAEHSSRFELTDQTKNRRRPIHIASWCASAVLLGLLIYSSYGLAQALGGSNWTALIIPAVKPIGLTIALLGLLSWYLRWMNRWFERHANAEFQLKQFELDIDRASWVVETALEWRYAQDNPIPDHLLESISRNLFARGEKDETADMHPADYLASALLGRASGVKLKVPGGELEYGKSAFKDVTKEAS